MVKHMSRTTKYLIGICVFLLSVNLTLGLILTKQSDQAIRSLIENRMLDVSNTAAVMLDGDALERLTADKSTPEYQSILGTLSAFQENINLSYIYCIRDMGNGNFVFTIDPDVDPGEFGEPIAYTDALYSASQGTAAVDKEPYGDRWGRFYSAYTPVYNSNREISGIVAVDFSAEWYEDQISNQVRSTFLISALSMVVAVVIVGLFAANFRKRFQLMLDEMNGLSQGIETLVHEFSPGVEVTLHQEEERDSSKDEVIELGNRIRSLEEQLSEQIVLVRSQAYVDGLTGLGNRSAYEDHVKRLDDDIREGTASFTLALFDMNGLKTLNDEFGHDQGDQAITAAADVLRLNFEDAKLYRIGGDEFIAILEDGTTDLTSRFRRVEEMLVERRTLSLAKGCAVYTPEDLGFRMVFNRADGAMYQDKNEYYQAHKNEKKR